MSTAVPISLTEAMTGASLLALIQASSTSTQLLRWSLENQGQTQPDVVHLSTEVAAILPMQCDGVYARALILGIDGRLMMVDADIKELQSVQLDQQVFANGRYVFYFTELKDGCRRDESLTEQGPSKVTSHWFLLSILPADEPTDAVIGMIETSKRLIGYFSVSFDLLNMILI